MTSASVFPDSTVSTQQRPRRDDALRALGIAVGLTLLAFAANIALSLGGVVAVTLLGVRLPQYAQLLLLTGLGEVGMALVGFGYVRRWLGGVTVRLPTGREWGWVFGGALLSIVVAVVLSVVRQLLLPGTGSVISDVGGADPRFFLGLAVLSLFVVAPAEELVFRGAIFGRLGRTFAPVAAVVGSSTVFGLLHVLNFTGGLAGAFAAAAVIGVVSLIWGFAYERTGNLAVPMLIHGLYNATLMAVAFLALAAL